MSYFFLPESYSYLSVPVNRLGRTFSFPELHVILFTAAASAPHCADTNPREYPNKRIEFPVCTFQIFVLARYILPSIRIHSTFEVAYF